MSVNPWADGYRVTAQHHIDQLPAGSLKGKVALVTGCTSGIGIPTARALVRGGATVFITGRKRSVLETVRDELNAEVKKNDGASNSGSPVKAIVMDLSSLSSVRAGAKEFLSQSSSLHILVENAGVMALNYKLNDDGLDMQFATNHIGHFLLFQLLKDVMLASAPSRLIVVSSAGHYLVNSPSEGIDYSRLPSVPAKDYSKMGAYQQSKLANVLVAQEVSKRYATQGLTAYSVHPGTIRTGLVTEVTSNSILFRMLIWLMSPLCKTSEQGAGTSVYCAVTPGIEQHAGQFFDCSHVTDRVKQDNIPAGESEKLWKWSEEWIQKHSEPMNHQHH